MLVAPGLLGDVDHVAVALVLVSGQLQSVACGFVCAKRDAAFALAFQSISGLDVIALLLAFVNCVL